MKGSSFKNIVVPSQMKKKGNGKTHKNSEKNKVTKGKYCHYN